MVGDLFLLLIGVVMGVTATWLIVTAKMREIAAKEQGKVEGERAALAERVAAKDRQIGELAAAVESSGVQINRLTGELNSQAERRAIAEEKNSRIGGLESELAEGRRMCDGLRAERAELRTILEKERQSAGEKLALVNDAKKALSDAFSALSSDALKSNNQSFLELAKSTLEKFQLGAQSDLTARQQAIDELLKPLKVSLEKVDTKIGEMEKERTGAYASLTEQVKSLGISQGQLQAETANLVTALRAPQVRGRWGEIQLKRVVELAGMIEHCDFDTQESVTTEDGRLRPDVVIRLPGGKNVVVDAKCPLQGYLDALAAPDVEKRLEHLKRHARQVEDHINKLAAKAYWEQFSPTPEFVFMFLPGETFYSAALEQNPSLIEMGVEQRVILATPTTLIALLRAVSYGWRQELIAKNYQEISRLGKDLHERIQILGDHFSKLGAGLNRAVDMYNRAVGSLEGRVLVSARKLREYGGQGKEIEIVEEIELRARELAAEEFAALPGPGEG